MTEDLYVTVPRGTFKKLATRAAPMAKIRAPVVTGQRLGTVTVALDGEAVAERPLVALGEVPRGGLWRRMSDSVKLWFE